MTLFPKFKVESRHPAKVAKPAKVTPNFSDFSKFSNQGNNKLESTGTVTGVPNPVTNSSRGDVDATVKLCHCGSRHYWCCADGWQCSGCVPMPNGFLGETCTISGEHHYPVTDRIEAAEERAVR